MFHKSLYFKGFKPLFIKKCYFLLMVYIKIDMKFIIYGIKKRNNNCNLKYIEL